MQTYQEAKIVRGKRVLFVYLCMAGLYMSVLWMICIAERKHDRAPNMHAIVAFAWTGDLFKIYSEA